MANYPFYVDLEANSRLNLKASSAQSLTASSAIAPNASAVDISSTANITLTSTPTISAGVEGQWLIVNNTGSYAIVLQSETQLSGTNLQLFNKTIPIPSGTPLLLQYRGTKWQQRAWGSVLPEHISSSITSAASVNIDLALGQTFTLNLTQNTTVAAIQNFPPGATGLIFHLIVIQDSTGGRTLTLPANCALTGSIQASTISKTLLKFVTADIGNTWEVVATQLSSSVFNSANVWLDAEYLLVDQSGNGNNASQSDSTRIPTYSTNANLNNKATWIFDGGNDGLETSLSLNPQTYGSLTIYVVFRRNNTSTAFQVLAGFDGTVGGYQRTLAISNNEFTLQVGNGNWATGVAASNSTNYLAIAEYSSTNVRLWVNGTLYSRGSAEQVNNNTQPLWVGMGYARGQNYAGEIASVVVAAATKNTNIENYLKSKYGFTY